MSPTSSLCCTNADEVLLLLRASDRVAHDICHALQDATAAATAADGGGGGAAAAGSAPEAPPPLPPAQHCLALRRWYDLQPGREFRCFVRGHALVGASQRDVTQCFDFLKEERAELAATLLAFHAKHIAGWVGAGLAVGGWLPACLLASTTCGARLQACVRLNQRVPCCPTLPSLRVTRAGASRSPTARTTRTWLPVVRCACWTSTPWAAPPRPCSSPGTSWAWAGVRQPL